MARTFDSDDKTYLEWLVQHPGSFVVNVHRTPRAHYVVLHRSECAHIRHDRHTPGAYTERGYKKLWAPTVDEVRAAVQTELKDKHADFSNCCGHCHPIQSCGIPQV